MYYTRCCSLRYSSLGLGRLYSWFDSVELMTSLTEEKSYSDMLECGQHSLLVLSMAEESGKWLNASELTTVLDMLAVMETSEELKILECLTPQQKRQVWDATPYELRVRLHQVKNYHQDFSAIAVTAKSQVEPELVHVQDISQTEADHAKLDLYAIVPNDVNSDEGDSKRFNTEDIHSGNVHPEDWNVTAWEQEERPPTLSTLTIGDRAVLKAKSGLNKAELIAIFEIVDIQSDWVECKADTVGGRRYPVDWLVIYPR